MANTRTDLFNRIGNDVDSSGKVSAGTDSTWSAGVAFKRSNPIPIDKYSVFKTLTEAQNYALKNAVAYPGQILAVIPTTGATKLYVINSDGTLAEAGGSLAITDYTASLPVGEESNFNQIARLDDDAIYTQKITRIPGTIKKYFSYTTTKTSGVTVEIAQDSVPTANLEITALEKGQTKKDVTVKALQLGTTTVMGNITFIPKNPDNLSAVYLSVGPYGANPGSLDVYRVTDSGSVLLQTVPLPAGETDTRINITAAANAGHTLMLQCNQSASGIDKKRFYFNGIAYTGGPDVKTGEWEELAKKDDVVSKTGDTMTGDLKILTGVYNKKLSFVTGESSQTEHLSLYYNEGDFEAHLDVNDAQDSLKLDNISVPHGTSGETFATREWVTGTLSFESQLVEGQWYHLHVPAGTTSITSANGLIYFADDEIKNIVTTLTPTYMVVPHAFGWDPGYMCFFCFGGYDDEGDEQIYNLSNAAADFDCDFCYSSSTGTITNLLPFISIPNFAKDAGVVHNYGDETILGNKCFQDNAYGSYVNGNISNGAGIFYEHDSETNIDLPVLRNYYRNGSSRTTTSARATLYPTKLKFSAELNTAKTYTTYSTTSIEVSHSRFGNYKYNFPEASQAETTLAVLENFCTDVHWSKLQSLVANNELIPGAFYRIVDYVCTTTQEYTFAAGHKFDIIVRADSKNKLNENATACLHRYKCTFATESEEDSDIQFVYIYSNSNGTYNMALCDKPNSQGKSNISGAAIIFNSDSYHVTTTLKSSELTESVVIYDYFQNCNVPAWQLKYCINNDISRFAWAQTEDATAGHTLSLKTNGSQQSDADDIFCPELVGKIDGVTYQYMWVDSAASYGSDLLHVVCSNNKRLTVDESVDFILVSKVAGEDRYTFVGGETATITAVDNEGRGVIYWMIDNRENECPYDFKNIKFKGSALYQSDSSWFAADNYYYTFFGGTNDEIDSSVYGTCIGNRLNSYISDNNVYYLPYIVVGAPSWYNYFAPYCYNITLQSNNYYNSFDFNSYNIKLAVNANSNIIGKWCHDNSFGNEAAGNILGDSCYENILDDRASYNELKKECKRNTLQVLACYNILDTICSDNVLGEGSISNSFGYNCQQISIDGSNNIFEYWNSSITLGVTNAHSNDNLFKAYTQNITLGELCDGNTFGVRNSYITFGNGCSYNTFGNNIQYVNLATTGNAGNAYYNQFDDNIEYLNITAADSSGLLQNIHVGSGIKGISSAYKVITEQRGLIHDVTYRAAGAEDKII